MLLVLCMAISLCAGISVTAGADDGVITYTVKSGDYMYKICKNLGLDYYSCKNAIMVLNSFSSETQMNRIYVGQTIKLPESNAVAASVTTTTTTTVSVGTTAVSTTSTTTSASSNDSVKFYIVPHTVVSGETLYSICNSLGTSYSKYADMILAMNGINSVTHIWAGKLIYIPVEKVPSSGTYYSVVAHKVVSGDTMTSICNTYGLNYSANATLISGLNDGYNMNAIKVGQTVYIPTTKTVSPVTPTSTTTATPVSGAYAISFDSGAHGSPYATVSSARVTSANAGQTVVIEANPDSGYVLKSVSVTKKTSGAAVAVSNNSFTMPSDGVIIKVTYEAGQYMVKQNNPANGSFSVLVNGTASDCANNGDKIKLSITPDYGYKVKKVTYARVNGTGSDVEVKADSKGVYSFQMPNHNVLISVTFEAAISVPVTLKNSDGSNGSAQLQLECDGVSISGNKIPENTLVTVKIVPDEGCGIDSNTQVTFTASDCTLTKTKIADDTWTVKLTGVSSGATLKVNAKIVKTNKHSITVSSNVNGCSATVTVDKNQVSSAVYGSKVTVIPAASGKYEFDEIGVRAASGASFISVKKDTDGTYYFTMPNADVVISLTFKASATTNYRIYHNTPNNTTICDFVAKNELGAITNTFATGQWILIDYSNFLPTGYKVAHVEYGFVGGESGKVKYQNYAGEDGYWIQMQQSDLWIAVVITPDNSEKGFCSVSAASIVGSVQNPAAGSVAIMANGADVTGTMIKKGTVITLNIKPATGYVLDSVYVNGGGEVEANGSGQYTYKVTADVSFDVYFKAASATKYAISNSDPINGYYTIQVNDETAGARAAGSQAAEGDTITLWIVTTNTGYSLAQVEADGNVLTRLGGSGTATDPYCYRFTMPSHDVTTKVSFAQN